MCGIDYCATCPPTPPIVAWTEGRTHVRPKFGDGAQTMVAEYKRRTLLRRLVQEDPATAMQFPDYLAADDSLGPWVDHFASEARGFYDAFCAKIPAFSIYVYKHPVHHGRGLRGNKQRKARQRATRQARTLHISVFLFKEGGIAALRQMTTIAGRPMPPLRCEVVQPIEMAMAA